MENLQKFVICEKSEVNDTEQSVVGWGSKPIPDRDGELIESTAWKLDDYRKNPVLMLCHDYSTPPVGKVLWIKADSNGLKFKARFASTDRGKEIYQLYKDGIMSAFSVGFSPNLPHGVVANPTDVKYKGLKKVYKDVNLLEISCVPIPSCSEALIEYVKAGKIQTKQLKVEMDAVIEIVEKEIVIKPAPTMMEMPSTEEEGIEIIQKEEDKKEEQEKEKKSEFVCEDCGKPFSDSEECPECGGKMKPVSEKSEKDTGDVKTKADAITEKADAVVPEENKKLCPGGGVFGVNNGKFKECKDCEFAGECKEKSEEGKEKPTEEEKEVTEVGEKVIKSEEVETKVTDTSGTPSIFDITNAVSIALSGSNFDVDSPGIRSGNRYVVDLFPTKYPSGSVVYCEHLSSSPSYYRISYDYNDNTVTFIGTPEEVEQSWVIAKYGERDIETKDIETKDEEVEKIETKVVEENEQLKQLVTELKEGRVLSGKNRTLIQNAVSALNDLLAATEKEIKPVEEVEVIALSKEVEKEEPDEEELEIIKKEPVEPEPIIEIEERVEKEENTIEIDEEEIRSALTKALGGVLRDSVQEGVIIALKKARGKVD